MRFAFTDGERAGKVSLRCAVAGWSAIALIAALPEVFGIWLDCFPWLAWVAAALGLIALLAAGVGVLAGLAAIWPSRAPPQRLAGLGLALALLCSPVFTPVGDVIRSAFGMHTDFSGCEPNGLLGRWPDAWHRLRGPGHMGLHSPE